MKNKFTLLLIVLLMVGCSKNKAEDPLILPPNFNEMPDLQNKESDIKTENKDIQELRDLLLKKQ